MEQILYAVVAMIIFGTISGVTRLAYRHPEGYKAISCTLMALLMTITCALVAWNLAVTMTGGELHSLIEASKTVESGNVMRTLQIPSFILIAVPSLSVYLIFLLFLPKLLGTHVNIKGNIDKE
ncbi:hypothetical protein [Thiomicrorhabdus arctica]|uniref:hypothetical protein n=1 Tax=Thiomicrorhabdus arctica TaxID=131540 RepID=UPI0003772613|nr:hypothetical protein [Thiomicrorhabdus arctica]